MPVLSDTNKERVKHHLAYSASVDAGDLALLEDRCNNVPTATQVVRIGIILDQLDLLEKFLVSDVTATNPPGGDYAQELESRRLITGDVNRSDITYKPEEFEKRLKRYIKLTDHLALKLGVVSYHNSAHLDSIPFRFIGQQILGTTSGGGSGSVAGVTSWNGRTGSVFPASGDYTPSFIGALASANNLSDLASTSIARTNLGVAIGSQVQGFSSLLQAIVNNYSAASDGQVVTKSAGSLIFTTPGGGGGGGVNSFNGRVGVVTPLATDYTPTFIGALSAANNLSDLTNVGSARVNLALVPGTNVQAQSARLQEIVDLFSAAADGQVIGKSGSSLAYVTPSGGGAGVATFNGRSGAVVPVAGDYTPTFIGALATAQNLNDVPNKAQARSNMGLGIGTNVQAQSSLLQAIVDSFSAASNGYTLQKSGSNLVYAAPSAAAGVSSFNSRTGDVVPAAGDYPLSQTCGGRLALTYSDPWDQSDNTATTLYLLPVEHSRIYLCNAGGTLWTGYTIDYLSPPSITNSGLSANTNYDVFAYYTGSAVAIELSAWTNNTTRTDSVTRIMGKWVKASNYTRLLLGTVRTNASIQFTNNIAQRFINNIYNKRPYKLKRTDTTASWTYNTSTWRQVRAAATNQVDFVLSEPGVLIDLIYQVYVSTGISTNGWVAIGIDSTTAPHTDSTVYVSPSAGALSIMAAMRTDSLASGYHYAAMLEYSAGGNTSTFFGVSSGFEICKMVGSIMG